MPRITGLLKSDRIFKLDIKIERLSKYSKVIHNLVVFLRIKIQYYLKETINLMDK